MEDLMICEVCGTKMKYLYTKKIGEHIRSMFKCPKCKTHVIKRDKPYKSVTERRYI